jgi:hypothetical protein
MNKGIAVSLRYKHDYTEDAVLIYNPRECIVYLFAKEPEHENSFVKLEFSSAKCIQSARSEACSAAKGIYPAELGSSFIVELTDSKWSLEANKLYARYGSSAYLFLRHFVLANHDIFHEILAESFTEKLIVHGEPEYEGIKKYFPR